MINGKFIVIEGGDGSGKFTQTKLLADYLTKEKQQVKVFDFPRYETFFGKLVGRFLNGEFGQINDVSPYLISLAYAADRWQARDEMINWLKKGNIIISSRYATSNLAHQVAKVPKEKKQKLSDWLIDLEYRQYKIPKEDIVIYLFVPWHIGMQLVLKKPGREYLKNLKKLDIAEADINHQSEAGKEYFKLAKSQKNWITINCLDKQNKIRSKENIHQEIVRVLKDRKILE